MGLQFGLAGVDGVGDGDEAGLEGAVFFTEEEALALGAGWTDQEVFEPVVLWKAEAQLPGEGKHFATPLLDQVEHFQLMLWIELFLAQEL